MQSRPRSKGEASEGIEEAARETVAPVTEGGSVFRIANTVARYIACFIRHTRTYRIAPDFKRTVPRSPTQRGPCQVYRAVLAVQTRAASFFHSWTLTNQVWILYEARRHGTDSSVERGTVLFGVDLKK